jgi:hypothetical protein
MNDCLLVLPNRPAGIHSSAEEEWLSSITETLRTWRYVMQETYESPEENKED